jgi:mRNA-degrading endonuclease RelE of RelBE toxin-antitoxin system
MTELEDDENIEESVESRFNRDELKIDVSQDVAALLSGEELSEDFERKAATIFEAAVTDKVEKEIEKLDSKFDEMVTEEVAEIHGSLSTQINDYMSYVKDLFQKNYIDIPENKVDVIAELVDKVENLEKKLNEEMERNVELSMDNDVKSKARIVTETCGGLADTEVEKITELAENISFKDAESYRDSIETLRESYFPKTPTWEEEEVEVLDGGTSSSTDVEVSSVMSAINRTVPKR